MDNKGSILTKEKIEQEYGKICKFQHYPSLITDIPIKWKQTLQNGKICNSEIPYGNDCIINLQGIRRKLEEVSTNDVYWYLVFKICQRPTSESKWKENFIFQIIDEMWNSV